MTPIITSSQNLISDKLGLIEILELRNRFATFTFRVPYKFLDML